MEFYLPVIWAVIIATAVAMYVILDGFDLGIGILFPFAPSEEERDQMMNAVAPFWDGNETWLVLGGGGLLVAFPLAYAVIMPAVYLPIIVMLLALVFRGVAFEFRWIAKPRHLLWDVAFAGGSILAAFAQGLVLGGLLQGIAVADNAYAGGAFDWLTPFSLLCGIGLVAGYALLGATFLIGKTEGAVAERSRRQAGILVLAVLAIAAVVSLWTPLAFERIFERWFTAPNVFLLWPLPLATAWLGYVLWTSAASAAEWRPFMAAIGIFLLSFIGLGISTFPYLVPPTLTIWDTAAHPNSQIFMLIGVLVLLPVIFGYTVFIYWTFRGKVRPGEGYH
ncbi:MAG TPA: cytochrome d ubiquinol oxidase subunit II [Afifellaceae bacterium]|nr:cytochrome d ubiquinol oxidase subunit II [Afifellaceae bacterium]